MADFSGSEGGKDRTPSDCKAPASSSLAEAIFGLLEPIARGKSVTPEAVARAARGDGWRRALGQVRAEAVGLARQGKITITRHGRPADPNRLKGVYRLRLPMPGDQDAAERWREPAAEETEAADR